MTAVALISDVLDRGLTIRPAGRNVLVSPQKALSIDLIDRIQEQKPALIRELARLRKLAGDDWDEIARKPEPFSAFLCMVQTVRAVRAGQVPEHYTATTNCRQCGPVPIWPGLPAEVAGCPWCFNRRRGLPVPQ